MKTFAVTTAIRAAPEKIWHLLTDAPRYPAWNPTVTKLEGRIARGERVVMHVTLNTGRAFPVTVSQFEPGRRMIWTGGMPLGLFRGVRTYTLAPEGAATRFTMREEYTGPLLGMIWKSIPDLGPSFEEFASGLKAAAEKPA